MYGYNLSKMPFPYSTFWISWRLEQLLKRQYIVLPGFEHHFFVFLFIRCTKFQDHQLEPHRSCIKGLIIRDLTGAIVQKEALPKSGHANLGLQGSLHVLGRSSFEVIRIKAGQSFARCQETHLHGASNRCETHAKGLSICSSPGSWYETLQLVAT